MVDTEAMDKVMEDMVDMVATMVPATQITIDPHIPLTRIIIIGKSQVTIMDIREILDGLAIIMLIVMLTVGAHRQISAHFKPAFPQVKRVPMPIRGRTMVIKMEGKQKKN